MIVMAFNVESRLSKLREKTGYNIVQEYGQRITGPPPFWSGPPPPKGCEVFVGKLPRDIFEDELFPLFERPGTIYVFRLMLDFSTSNRGFGFVTYTGREVAQNAIALLNGYEIRPGHRIGVLKSVDNCRLFLGHLPTGKSREEVFYEISKYTSGVVDVAYNCIVNNFRSKGFAIVEYESHRAASMARKVLIPGNVKLFGCNIAVDWATPEPDVNSDKIKSVTVLHVRNIPDNIDESYLFNLFSMKGGLPIHRIGKMKDFAFVHYYSRHDAEIALNKLNGINLNGCTIGITWAKPQASQNLAKANDKVPVARCAEGFITGVEQQNSTSIAVNPIEILCRICQENGWGEPVFQVIRTSLNADDSDSIFISKVVIPNFPHCIKSFAPPDIFYSAVESKRVAAECALKNIYAMYHYKNYETPIVSQNPNNIPEILHCNFNGETATNSSMYSPIRIPPAYGNTEYKSFGCPISHNPNSIPEIPYCMLNREHFIMPSICSPIKVPSAHENTDFKNHNSAIVSHRPNHIPELPHCAVIGESASGPSISAPAKVLHPSQSTAFFDEENFLNLLASAASLAHQELQTKLKETNSNFMN